MVIVRVRAEDRDDVAIADSIDDRLRGVGGIDDEHLRVVADEPDVVVDVPAAAVETELPRCDDPVDARAHSTTTATTVDITDLAHIQDSDGSSNRWSRPAPPTARRWKPG